MYVSAFELFRVGPGPSSIYTGVPQRAALRFVHALAADGVLPSVESVEAQLHGGLAFFGREHATDAALVAGLAGHAPEHCNAHVLTRCHAHAHDHGAVALGGRHPARFHPARDIRRALESSLAPDVNAVTFVARDEDGAAVATRMYFAGAGGAVIAEDEVRNAAPIRHIPYPYDSATALARACTMRSKRIQDLARANESALASPGEVQAKLAHAVQAMRAAVERGLVSEGMLPDGRARAAPVAGRGATAASTPAQRCALLATAVGEENATGGTIVCAPSAGAAGPVAALLYLWREGRPLHIEERSADFLLAAAAIGGLLRMAGVTQIGCQGEIGVGAAMAAAGFAAVNDGSCLQVLHAAERALEPHLGLPCDLSERGIGDPCIERGARAAGRAYEAAVLALRMPQPRVGLDVVARAMVESGRALAARPKAASISGLALNVVEC